MASETVLFYCVTKLDKKGDSVEILGPFSSELKANECIFQDIELLKTTNKNVVVDSLIINQRRIFVYFRNIGYLYTSKTLDYIYEISCISSLCVDS